MTNKVAFKPASKKQAMFLQSDADVIVYGGSAGSGKAQPLYSKVLTVCGWKKMKDIEAGDFVISPDNVAVKVLNTFFHKEKNIYEVTTHSGRVTRACDEHLWKVFLNKNKSKTETKILTTAEIIQAMNSGRKVKLPLCDKIGSKEDIDLPIDPYVMGVIIAEGGLTGRNVCISNKDEQLLDRVRQSLGEKYQLKPTSDGVTYRITPIKPERKLNKESLDVWCNSFKDILYELNLMGKNSYNKFIPKIYLNASIEQRLSLLKGLMDSDGTISDSLTCEYSTSSEKLSCDIRQLVHSLGGVVKISSRTPSYDYKGEKKLGATNYRVYIRMQDCKDLFYISRKLDKARSRKQLVTDEIVSVRFVGREPAKCISVDSEDHLYITDDYIVTHNTFTSLMRHMRWLHDPNYFGYIIRKNSTDMKGGGGAFDEARSMFKTYDPTCEPIKQPMHIRFRNGASLTFIGLDGQSGKDALQGKQISGCMVDEATHLSLDEIEWIISRLRTNAKEIDGSPLKPSIWLTCNPDPDSFIYDWLKDYYLYPEGTIIDGILVEGRPIPERNGHFRYYLNIAGEYVWSNSYEELYDKYSASYPVDSSGNSLCKPIKFQFIGATCRDNPPLLEANPMYESRLLGLGRIEQERLYWGNWVARQEASGYFKKEWTPIINSIKEEDVVLRVRGWDLAGSLPSESNPYPDFTVGVLIAKMRDGSFVVEHMERFQARAGEVESRILEITKKDREYYPNYKCFLPQDPAQAGLVAKNHYAKVFASHGVPIYFSKSVSGNSKLKNFEPFSSSAENGIIQILKGDWNSHWFKENEQFDGTRSTSAKKDDVPDATSLAFNVLASKKELPKLKPSMFKMPSTFG